MPLVTQANTRNVGDFIQNLPNKQLIQDSEIILELMSKISGSKAVMWGNKKVLDFIIGFGQYSYQRKGNAEEFNWFKLGFAPRKSKITLYLGNDLDNYQDQLQAIGKCTWGKGCLYLKKLADIDMVKLERLMALIFKSFDTDADR